MTAFHLRGPRAAPAQPNSINPQAQIAVGNGNEDARLASPGGEASRQSFTPQLENHTANRLAITAAGLQLVAIKARSLAESGQSTRLVGGLPNGAASRVARLAAQST